MSAQTDKHGIPIIDRYGQSTIRIRCNSPGFIEMVVMETDTAIRMNTLVHPWAPIHPITQRRHHLTDDMVAGAPTFRQILTDLITVTDGRVILAYNSGSAFDTVIREAQRAELDPETPGRPWQLGGASHKLDLTGSGTRITTSRSPRHPVRSASATRP
jgi:hypothetical protein